MTFYELIWQGEGVGDAGDLEEALLNFQEIKPKDLSWAEVFADRDQDPPSIRRYRSFEAFLDNEDELETIQLTQDMLERFAPDPT
ncbi:MAG: hypothetical protein ACO3GW_05675 [Vulcanococcus sp.]|jgi:hypothetical protein